MASLSEFEAWSPNTDPIERRPAYPSNVVPILPEITRCDTVYKLFQRQLLRDSGRNYLGRRSFLANGKRGPYTYLTYKQVFSIIHDLGIGLNVALGLQPGDHIAIWMPNQPEWVIIEQCCNRFGFISVPLFDALSTEQTEYVIDHSDAKVIFTAPRTTAAAVDACAKCPNLQYIVEIDTEFNLAMQAGWTVTAPDRVGEQSSEGARNVWRPYRCISTGVMSGATDIETVCAPLCACCGAERKRRGPLQFQRYSEILRVGNEATNHLWRTTPPAPPGPDDPASIVYTSGTTGTAKGVIVLHRALIACLVGWYAVGIYLQESDVHISILPLAHVYERSVSHALVCFGGALAFTSNGVHDILEDVSLARPCFLIGVPRLFEKISNGVLAKIEKQSKVTKALFWSVFYAKENLGQPGERFLGPLDDKVFGDIRKALGGRCRFIISGSAPLPAFVYRFFFVAFGLEAVLQGYGLTETAAAGTLTDFLNPVPSVGYNCPILEFKLTSVPDTVYNPLLGTGELLIRGQAVTPGYYKNEEASRAAMTADGWLRTGDIARINLDGSLSIIDRRKNMIKLGQGEYVCVERLEAIMGACPYVENILVHGSGYESQLVAVIVPSYNELKALVETRQPRYCSVDTFAGIVNSPSMEGGLTKQVTQTTPSSPATSHATPDERRHELQAWANSSAIASLLTAELAAFCRKRGLRGFEIPVAVIVEPEPFTVENGALTPTLKLRRPWLVKKYSKRIDALYNDLRRRNAKSSNSPEFGSDITGWLRFSAERMARGFDSWTKTSQKMKH